MPKCPKCSAHIDALNAYSMEENKQEVILGEGIYKQKPFLDYGASETIDSSCSKIDFECPECNQILFTNDGDSQDERVINFLKEK
mgnify:CR=1 FL=1